jgi:hypothetical protein
MNRLIRVLALCGCALGVVAAQAHTPSAAPVRTLGDAPFSNAPAQAAKSGGTVAPRKATSAPSLTLDISGRRAARNFYNAIYGQSDGIAANWTGSVASRRTFRATRTPTSRPPSPCA